MVDGSIIDSEHSLGYAFELWPVLLLSFVCGLGGTWVCRKIALRFRVVDKPDDLVKTHTEPVAYLGGIGIFAGCAIGIIAGIMYLRGKSDFGGSAQWLLGILGGGTIACFVGLADDIVDIKPWHKVLGQSIGAVVLVAVGIRPELDFLTELFGYQISGAGLAVVSFIFAMVLVLGATNSLNLLDGIDGLCASVTAVIAIGMLGLGMLAESQNVLDFPDPVRIIIALAVLGSVCGFLPFNKKPAKIFMGDAGSLFLGFMMAGLMMLFAASGPRWCLCSIMIFGLPILDTAVAFARRWLNKRPLFVPDRGHIYDQMMDRGISLNGTVGICCNLAGVYVLIALVMSQMRIIHALIVCVVVFAVSSIVVWKKGFLKMEGLRGAVQEGQ
ncbi:MAG: glycosyltransferase family 4 protein [Planctomycetota bacterium]